MDAPAVKVAHMIKSLLIAGVFSLIIALFVSPLLLESFLIQERELTKADVIVIMAGSPDKRIPPAVRLYREGRAPKILLANDGVFSAWSRKHQRNLYQVEWAREDLFKKGVPEEDIIMLYYTASGSIHDALNTRAYVLDRDDIESLLVVTSDYHTRRTLWTFQHVFSEEEIEIGIYPASNSSRNVFKEINVLSIEFIKYIYYRLRYGLFYLFQTAAEAMIAHDT